MNFFNLLWVVLVMLTVQWGSVLGEPEPEEPEYKNIGDNKDCMGPGYYLGSPCTDPKSGEKGVCDGYQCLIEVKG